MFAPLPPPPLSTLQRILPTNFIVPSNKRHTENTRIISSRFLYRDHLAPRTLSIKTKKRVRCLQKKKEEGGNLIGKDSLSASNFSCTPPLSLSFSYSQPILTKDLHDQKRLGVESVLRLVFSVNYKQGTETSKREARLRAQPSWPRSCLDLYPSCSCAVAACYLRSQVQEPRGPNQNLRGCLHY